MDVEEMDIGREKLIHMTKGAILMGCMFMACLERFGKNLTISRLKQAIECNPDMKDLYLENIEDDLLLENAFDGFLEAIKISILKKE